MTRFLFVTWDGSGNQAPTLGIAQALRKRGHDVVFAGYESQRARITAQGFPFAALERAGAALRTSTTGDKMAAAVAGIWATPAHFDDVREAATRETPDLLVIDCMLWGALAAAELYHLPAAILVHSPPGALVPPGGRFERFVLLEPVNSLRTAVELPAVASMWESWARFPTLCTTLPALDPLAASVSKAFVYVGPIQEELPPSGWQSPWSADDPRPLVLVSFSAGFAWDQTSRIQRTLDGLAERSVRVLVTSSMADTSHATVPANARVVSFVPHAEVLPRASAVVTHAGHGTVAAALAHGVPLVCLPNATSDQPEIAAQVAVLGAGIALDGNSAPPDIIGEAVMRLLSESSFAAGAHRLAGEIAAADAPTTAVAWLEAHAADSKSATSIAPTRREPTRGGNRIGKGIDMLDMNDPEQARIIERLQHELYAYFITVRPDGRPHAVPVCFLWEDSSILIFSMPESVKLRNLRQNPYVALALDSFGNNDFFSVIVEGNAQVVDEPGLDMTYLAYATKHAALSQRMFGTSVPPEEFIRRFSQVIRLIPMKIRHDD